MATRPAQARVAGVWTGLGGKPPPEASRTHITANFAPGQTTPTNPKNGDMWLDTSVNPPQKLYYWGEVRDATGKVTTAGSWHGDSGARTFVQDTDPTTPAGGSAKPSEGDLWITVTTPKTQVWHTTPGDSTHVAHSDWTITNVIDRNQPLGLVGESFNGSAGNTMDYDSWWGEAIPTKTPLTKGIYRLYHEHAHYGWSCDDGQRRKMKIKLPTGYDIRLVSYDYSIKGVKDARLIAESATDFEIFLTMYSVDSSAVYHNFRFAFDFEVTPQAAAAANPVWAVGIQNVECKNWAGYFGKPFNRLIRLANLS